MPNKKTTTVTLLVKASEDSGQVQIGRKTKSGNFGFLTEMCRSGMKRAGFDMGRMKKRGPLLWSEGYWAGTGWISGKYVYGPMRYDGDVVDGTLKITFTPGPKHFTSKKKKTTKRS